MNSSDARRLIDGYFDDVLTEQEHAELNSWLQADPEHAIIFAKASMLHDRLRDALASSHSNEPNSSTIWASTIHSSSTDSNTPHLNTDHLNTIQILTPSPSLQDPHATARLRTGIWKTLASVAAIAAGLAVVWFSISPSTASAAIRELDRIILNSIRSQDRTYGIVVEDVTTSGRRDKRSPEMQRPPKPPLDGAILHVRSGNQFVLIRKTLDGLPFVTGSNGQQSWAINTRGPVRVSSDVHHFDRDLPGHETSVPLTNLHEGLEQLKRAYHLEFSELGPEEYAPEDDSNEEGHEARLLVAIKKPRERGPQRVEIVYDSTTGRILRMRFVQMPYGPDRLDLRLSLESEVELPAEFFEHTSHHEPDRKIEMEN